MTYEYDRRLREQLTDLEALLREQQAPIVDHWLPGLPADIAQRHAADRLGLGLPCDLEVWYGWHNGSSRTTGDESRIVLDRFLMSLDECFTYYELQRRVARQVGSADGFVTADQLWHPAWFPFTVNGTGDALVLDIRQDPAPVLSVVLHDRDRGLLAAPTLADAVAFWAMLIRKGWWRCDPDHGWVCEWEQMPPELHRHPLV